MATSYLKIAVKQYAHEFQLAVSQLTLLYPIALRLLSSLILRARQFGRLRTKEQRQVDLVISIHDPNILVYLATQTMITSY